MINISNKIKLRSIDTKSKISDEWCNRKLVSSLKSKEIKIGNYDKVFTSIWLNEYMVLVGTKCSSLLLINTSNNKITPILNGELDSYEGVHENANRCGVREIKINSSKTLLAISNGNIGSIMIYKLPSLELIKTIAKFKDWVYCLEWLDVETLILGTRDGNMCIWNISKGLQYFHIINRKVRSLTYNFKQNEVLFNIVKNCQSKFILLDLETLNKKYTFERFHNCVTSIFNDSLNLYSVSSEEDVFFFDSRCSKQLFSTSNHGVVRSLEYMKNDILTIGSDTGAVLFYDHRNRSVISSTSVKGGWRSEKSFYQIKPSRTIYTTCWSEDQTKLFVAGGQLEMAVYGNFVNVLS